jgi:hypothetical protein
MWEPVPLIVGMHFSTSLRETGWSNNDVLVHDRLSLQHNIRMEDTLGIEACRFNSHIGYELGLSPEHTTPPFLPSLHRTPISMLCSPGADVLRFSSTDNYWCFGQERKVHVYSIQSTNMKHIEVTLARQQCLKLFLLQKRLAEVHKASLRPRLTLAVLTRRLYRQSTYNGAVEAMRTFHESTVSPSLDQVCFFLSLYTVSLCITPPPPLATP